jgi:asparagine synthase (glutamine-hydrolysing)
MSGICAVIHWRDHDADPSTIHAMTSAAAHRGPDGIHTWTNGPAHLAHLAHHITPEDHHTHQPLASGPLTLIADARIDNRDELIPTLTATGHLHPHPTDADIILAAHHHWGHHAPTHLTGDYAYAIWDTTTHTLTAARDPMAMRPLYYRAEPHRLLLATEITQILAAPNVTPTLNERMVASYLTGAFGPLDATFYEGIDQLEPGHTLTATRTAHHTTRHWTIDPHHRIRHPTEHDYAHHFRHLFTRAVKDRLRTTTTPGILLSGGMDSGSIASTAGHLHHHDPTLPTLHTYSWAFESLPECDERHVSDLIARHYALATTYVSADDAPPLAHYPDHGPHRDEPYIGVYQPLIERSLELARSDGVRAMFSGDRGDLMIGAFVLSYPHLIRTGRWPELLAEVRSQAALTATPLAKVVANDVIATTLRRAWRTLRTRGVRGRSGSTDAQGLPPPAPWLRPEFLERVDIDDIAIRSVPTAPEGLGYVRSERYRLIFTMMHARGMVWSDRTAARFGQAFLDPWSDRRLASFVLAIPQQALDRPGRLDKRLVRAAMEGIMPESARTAASKVVPSPLFARALREQAVDTVRSLISDSQAAARGFVDEDALRAHYDDVRRGAPDHPGLWWTLTLEMWLRRYWS